MKEEHKYYIYSNEKLLDKILERIKQHLQEQEDIPIVFHVKKRVRKGMLEGGKK